MGTGVPTATPVRRLGLVLLAVAVLSCGDDCAKHEYNAVLRAIPMPTTEWVTDSLAVSTPMVRR